MQLPGVGVVALRGFKKEATCPILSGPPSVKKKANDAIFSIDSYGPPAAYLLLAHDHAILAPA